MTEGLIDPPAGIPDAVLPEAQPVLPTEFRSLMATFPSGVAVVTAVSEDGDPKGMTCSSVCSVSLEPPTLLVCLRRHSPTLQAIQQQASFAVNLLPYRAKAAAELFSSGAPDRFDRVHWQRGDGGPHLVGEAHAIADCVLSQAQPVGDHTVVFGSVIAARQMDAANPRPLLYGLRQYASW